jgi:hypothetical protein
MTGGFITRNQLAKLDKPLSLDDVAYMVTQGAGPLFFRHGDYEYRFREGPGGAGSTGNRG